MLTLTAARAMAKNPTPTLVAAIEAYMAEHGLNQIETAKRLGVSQVTVSRWLSGQETIRKIYWPKIREVCARHLPPPEPLSPAHEVHPPALGPVIGGRSTVANSEDLRYVIMHAMLAAGDSVESACRAIQYDPPATLHRLFNGELQGWFPDFLSKLATHYRIPFSTLPISPAERALLNEAYRDLDLVYDVPVVSLAAAATMPVVNGQCQFAESLHEAEETVRAPTSARHYAAFRAEGTSMVPKVAPGQVVIVDTSRAPHPGQMVVARLAQDGVVVKWFDRKGGTIILYSEADDGETFRVPSESVVWMYPVAETLSRNPTTRRRPIED